MQRRMLLVLVFGGIAALALVYILGRRTDEDTKTGVNTSPAPSQNVSSSSPASPKDQPVCAVSGRVVDSHDRPIAGATVNLHPDDLDTELDLHEGVTATSVTGNYLLDGIPEGSYALSASAPGYLPASTSIALAPGVARDGVVLRLEQGGARLFGVVADATGGAIAQAIVRVLPLGGPLSRASGRPSATLTDDDGRYEMNLADGRYVVWANHGDYVPKSSIVQISGSEQKADFSLVPGAVVEGTVARLSDGKPVAGAEVLYSSERVGTADLPGALTGRLSSGTITADERGLFRITGLSSGALRLSARGQGLASHEDTRLTLGIGEEQTGVEVFVSDAFSLRGVVRHKGSDKTVPGARVFAFGPQMGAGSTVTADDEGRFVIDSLVPGTYTFGIDSDVYLAGDLRSNATIIDKDVEVVLEVEQGATVSGRVEPATEADVQVAIDPGRFESALLARSSRSSKDGQFSIGPLRPGKVTLEATTSDGRAGKTTIDIPPEGAADVVIALEEKASVAGVVLDGKGKPVGDVRVELRTKTNGSRRVIINGRDMTAPSAQTGPDGKFRIVGIDASTYELSVVDAQEQPLAWADGKDRQSPLPIAVAQREHKQGLVLRVEARNAVLRGVVLGPDGRAVADAWVTATPARGRPGFVGAPFPGAGNPGDEREREPPPDGEVHESMVMIVSSQGEEDGPGLDLGALGSLPPVLTDDAGRFEIAGLRSGTYGLVAEGAKGEARAFATGAHTDREHTLKLASLARIEGRVVQDGQPVKSFIVSLDVPSRWPKQVHDEDGRFVLHRVDPGDYKVHVASALGEGEVSVLVEPGKTATAEVLLEGLVQVTGRVVDENGEPVAHAFLIVGPPDPGMVSIEISGDTSHTQEDGSFQVGVRPGRHMLRAIAPDRGLMAASPIEVAAAAGPVDLGTLKATPTM